MALFAAVEQCRATGGQLAWGAIAATVPGRSASRRGSAILQAAAGPHSPHVGLPEAGASVFKMMEVSRHKSVDVVSGKYVRSANAFVDHAGAKFL